MGSQTCRQTFARSYKQLPALPRLPASCVNAHCITVDVPLSMSTERHRVSITSNCMCATSTKDRATLTTITARQRHSANQSSTLETCYLRKQNRACPFRKAHAPNPARPEAEPRGKAAVGVWGTALPGVPCCCMTELYIATFTKPTQLRQILLDRIPSCYALGAARVNASISHFHASGVRMSVIDSEWFSTSG